MVTCARVRGHDPSSRSAAQRSMIDPSWMVVSTIYLVRRSRPAAVPLHRQDVTLLMMARARLGEFCQRKNLVLVQ